jgi:hypothetical protein
MGSTHNQNSRQKRHASQTIITDLSSAIEELRQTGDEPEDFDDCYSIKDMCDKLGENRAAVYDIVNDCIANGTCEHAGKRRGVGIDGRIKRTPVYKFKFKNKRTNK